MKTIWLFILMIIGATQLKAQQLTQPGKTAGNSLYQYFKPKRDSDLFKIAPVQPKAVESTPVPTVKEVMVAEVVDNMPIVKTRSDDKMPIVKPGNPNTHYTMLIQGYGKLKPDSISKQP
ncbi:MAG: hypothetical protein AAGC65_21555 [Mucilaginibacter sp.]|uniref:hypothetical protein n=1 Tax=Mucilaginibacter sp. TaxID=1882438 RepID=UPI0031A67E32